MLFLVRIVSGTEANVMMRPTPVQAVDDRSGEQPRLNKTGKQNPGRDRSLPTSNVGKQG